MAYVHSKGIAHLDLKTTNILLSVGRDQTVVADFGISQTVSADIAPGRRGGAAVSSGRLPSSGIEMVPIGGSGVVGLSSGGTLALTPHYAAPERLLRTELAFADLLAADVYSYGGSGTWLSSCVRYSLPGWCHHSQFSRLFACCVATTTIRVSQPHTHTRAHAHDIHPCRQRWLYGRSTPKWSRLVDAKAAK